MSKEQREQQIINEVDNYRDGDPVMTKLLNRNAAIGLALHIAEWADSHPHWIPVEKELPPPIEGKSYSDECLVAGFNGLWHDVLLYDYDSKKWINLLEVREGITHWMPIVPPKEE